MATKIQVRRDTSANWTSINPTLFEGEIGFETNTGKLKVGRSNISWNNLPYSAYTSDDKDNDLFYPTSGLDVYPRILCNAVRSTSNGTVFYSLFTPTKNITISNIAAFATIGATDSGGTTVRRMGIHSYNKSTHALALLARTASDSSLFTASATLYTRALATTGGYPASLTLSAGVTYAVSFLMYNTGGTFNGPSLSSPLSANGLQNITPYWMGSSTGATDLPTTSTLVAGVSLAAWARLT